MKTILAAAAVVMVLPLASSALAQGKGGPKAPPIPQGIIVDATGKSVGPFFVGSPATVLVSLNGRNVAIPLEQYFPAGLSAADVSKMGPSSGYGDVYFQYADCTGQAYVVSQAPYLGTNPAAITTNHSEAIAYVASGTAMSELVSALATRDRVSGVCYSTAPPRPATFFPVIDVVDLVALWAFPFSIK